MLIKENPNEIKSLVIGSHAIEVVMSEDGVSPLSLVVPPYEDISEIQALQHTHFSIKEWTLALQAPMVAMLRSERLRLLKKYEKYSQSPIYLNRIANLASIAGDFEEEGRYLQEASYLSDDEFFSNGVAESLIARQFNTQAEALLAKADLTKNLYANLRLAAMYALREDIPKAVDRVAAALDIDPLDFSARLFDGALKLWSGENEKAILSFRIASEKRPNSAALHTNLAVAYVRLGRKEKALQCLKMAVAIDPLSLNAVTFLADIAHALNRNEDAIPSLRYFIRYEQKNSGVWGRLARALLKIGEASEAIAAVKRQASLEDSSRVWNNLGVAYNVKQDRKKALESFKHALTLASDQKDFGFCIAATNFAALSIGHTRPEEILKFIDEIVRPENIASFASHRELSKIFPIKLRSLLSARRVKDAAAFGEEVLQWKHADPDLITGIAMGLMSLYSLNEGGGARALEIARKFSDLGLYGRFFNEEDRIDLLNNIAFVFAEHDDLEQAARHLQAISGQIHKQPYPTATSGLLHFKKGHIELADQLYGEALRLCRNVEDKSRIRQKWNLELGKAAMVAEPRKALRFLIKARQEDAEAGIANQAAALIKALPIRLL